jgi:hypothetical protein
MRVEIIFITLLISFLSFSISGLAIFNVIRVPTSCSDSDPSCTVDYVSSSNDIWETTTMNPSGYINATVFNGTIPSNAVIKNISADVEWKTNSGKGCWNFYTRYYNKTNGWIQCTGPWGETLLDWTKSCYFNETVIGDINTIKIALNGTDNDSKGNCISSTDFFQNVVNYTTPPNYTDVGINATDVYTGDAIKHYTQWGEQDGEGESLSYYIFSWNGTGANCDAGFSNDSALTFSTNPDWSNITKTIPATCGGKIIGWQIYANNSQNAWNSTAIQTYTVVTAVISFLVQMPANYGPCPSSYCYNITADTEATANQTSWISFNFSSSNENFREPYRVGSSSDTQDNANKKPIFRINNTGNRNISVSLKFNETVPAGIAVGGNASCDPDSSCCGTVQTSLINLGGGTTYQYLGQNLQNTTTCALNITLWGNVSGVTPGESLRYLFIKGNRSDA